MEALSSPPNETSVTKDLNEDSLESLGELFVSLLEDLTTGYGRYAELSGKQRLALVNNQRETIQFLNQEMECTVQELDHLNKKRQSVAEAILTSAGMPLPPRPLALKHQSNRAVPGKSAFQSLAPISCEDICRCLPEYLASRVRGGRKGLLETLSRVQGLNRTNLALVEAARSIIHTTVGIVTNVAQRSRKDNHSLYQANGRSQGSQKQVRSLINCKV